MKKLISFLLIFLFFTSITLFSVYLKSYGLNFIYAEDDKCSKNDLSLEDIDKCLADFEKARAMSINATKPLETDLIRLQAQIKNIKNSVVLIENDIVVKKKNIDDGYKNLGKQIKIFNQTVKDYYIKSYYNSPILIFLSGDSASEMTQIMAYQRKTTDQDKMIITNLSLSITDLESKKKNLEEEQVRLTAVKANLDEQSAKLDKIVSGAKAYQATLSGKIANLSAKQQELLAQKLGSLNLPKSAYSMKGGCTDDRNIDPGFSPRFALFTYGVPNRIGLSQFGAWGRAKAKQGYEEILRAYYNFDNFQDVDTNTNIRVNDSNGFNSGNIIWSGGLEEYIKRIYEVPDSWTDNDLAVLKAQAIAARSYVLAATNNGAMSICANEYCQAFQTNPKGGNWETAVNATPGKVMMQGGQPIKAWYSSTHGGYVFTSGDIGWSQTGWTKRAVDASGGISSFSDLQNNAYDKNSPIFYCDWGSRGDFRGHDYKKTAWMRPEEMADIVNSILLVENNNSADPHILQTDKNYPEAWNEEKVKQELGKYRTPFNSVSSGHVDADFGTGRTTRVYFSGDAGSVDFSADVFKKYFNLRAPSNINIVGPLYNVERK